MKDKRIPLKGNRDIMKLAQKTRCVTQAELANKIGIRQSSMSGNLNRSRMSLDTFEKVLDALEYDIVVVDRNTGEPMWKLYVEREAEEDDI